MRQYFTLVLFLTSLVPVEAQPGRPDPLFGINGIATTNTGQGIKYDNSGRQVLLQPDGSMYLVVETAGGTVIIKKLADGSPDVKYGDNGMSRPVGIYSPHAAMQADGKIVVAGYSLNSDQYTDLQDFAVARYNTDGTPDNSFAGDGLKTTNFDHLDIANAIAIQSDGKIVVAGYTDDYYDVSLIYMAIARYNADGSPDSTFDEDGLLKLPYQVAAAIAIQHDGKIVVSNGSALARYNSDGSLDNTFYGGDFFSPGYAVGVIAIQGDGKILMTDGRVVMRFGTDGTMEKIFDTAFKAPGSSTVSLAIQNDGKILLASYTREAGSVDFGVARYDIDGNFDKSFSDDGKQLIDFGSYDDYASSIAVSSAGNLVIAGYTTNGVTTNLALAVYDTHGDPQNSFSEDGKLTEEISRDFTLYTSTAAQNDGKILAAGYTWNGSNYDFLVVRYNSDGTLDNTFSSGGLKITDFSGADDKAWAIAVQADGKILLAGSSGNNLALARYNADGTPDATFGAAGLQSTDFGFANSATSVAIQADGKILAGGSALARYNTNGSLDSTFDADGKLTRPFIRFDDEQPFNCRSLALQADGKILVAGSINPEVNEMCIVARYNADGSTDNTFGDSRFGTYGAAVIIEIDNPLYQEDFSFYGNSLAVQKNGDILIGGYYTSVFRGAVSRFSIARLTKDGRLDDSFDNGGILFTAPGSGNVSYGTSMIQNDDKIILAGYSYNGISNDFTIARFNSDGSLDNIFGEGGIAITDVSGSDDRITGIAIANNKLYAAGSARFLGSSGVVAAYLLTDEKLTVRIKSPDNNATYTGPALIPLTAEATDPKSAIRKVELYNGDTLLRTEYFAPYSWNWKNVPPGNYTITAKAYNSSNDFVTSAPVRIAVNPNQPPFVYIDTPSDNEVIPGPANIILEANASDNDGKITRVELYNGQNLLRTEYFAPYSWNWKKVPPGNYTVTAKAYDDHGGATLSPPVSIMVMPPAETTPSGMSAADICTGIHGVAAIELAPNPAKNILIIYAAEIRKDRQLTVSILSSSGATMKIKRSTASSGFMQVDVSSLSSGVYTIRIVSNGKATYRQFVKL